MERDFKKVNIGVKDSVNELKKINSALKEISNATMTLSNYLDKMKENIIFNTLIIPDVHNRNFWKKPVYDTLKNNPNMKIVFLGDYLDGYSYEGFDKEEGIKNLEEIIKLKKENPDKITLLIGNHDCTYIFGTSVCECRTDYINFETIEKLFNDNIDLFDICCDEIINDRRIVYSHAGFKKSWVNDFKETYNLNEKYDEDTLIPCNIFNDKFHEAIKTDNQKTHNDFRYLLKCISFYRGGYESYGSVVWADIREYMGSNSNILYNNITQIVGHSQLKENAIIINDKESKGVLYDVDSRQPFLVGEDSCVYYYNSKELIS